MVFRQPVNGYRFSLDPLILCSRIAPGPGDHILDLGCGCGVMPLVLGYRHPDARITGVDIQETLTDLAAENVSANRMQERIRILHRDINRLSIEDIGHPADIIISNPPYKKKGTGRINPNREKAIARHEILVTINQIFKAAASLMAPKGRLYLIFPADRTADLKKAAAASDLSIESTCLIHRSKDLHPFRVIISAVKSRTSQPRSLTPLILYQKDNTPTKAHKALFNP